MYSLDNRLLLVLFETVDDLDGIKQVQDMESRFVEWDKLLSPKPVIFVLALVLASRPNCELIHCSDGR